MVFRKEKLGALLSKVGSGVTPKGGSDSYVSEGVPLIRSQNVLWGKLSTESIAYIEAKQHAKMSGSVVRPNDVLLNITGASIGRACVVPSTLGEANVNQHVCILRVGENLDSTFLCNFLISQQGQREIALFQAGGNREGLNYEQVRSFEIPLPSLAEQRKIAEILRTWDEAIETAEAELKAKQDRKRWLMDRHFKFSPESHLEQVKMQDAVDVLKGEQLNRHTLTEKGSYPVWNGGITPSGYTESFNTEGPAVIMSEGGNSCGAITRVNENFWRGGHCYHVVPRNGFSNDYLYAALKYYESQIMRLRVGSGLPNIQKKSFLAWGTPLHKPAYRDKVARVFTHAQLEGELANKHIEALRAQKCGLMQKLLTGEVRVAA